MLNARVNLIFYFLTLVLSFFSRKIFLDFLGADFVGLTGTLYNLLGFLNLAELGIGTAIGYVLYKPLFEHDEERINEIISVLGYLYRWIGLIILGIGLILACFLPLIFPNTGFDIGLIYFAYFSFLSSSLIGYFANYKQTLLGADQRNYVVTAYFQTATIIKTLIQMALAYYTKNYYLWVIIELTFGVIYSFILNWKINQVYPWLKGEVKQGKQLFNKYPEVMKYTKQLFVHQINSFVQFQITPFIIYAFVSLKIVAYYGNYTIIIDKMTLLMNNFLGSTAAGVGNLIAEGNNEKIYNTFWELTCIRFLFAGIITFSLYFLIDAFITLWLGEEYVLSKVALILMLSNIYIRVVQGAIGQFLYGFGLFKDIWASILQSIIFITVALIGGKIWGLEGILLANIVSVIAIMGLWKPYFLYKDGFRKSTTDYWLSWIGYFCIACLASLLTTIITHFISFSPYENFGIWLLYAAIVSSSFTIIYIILQLLLSKSMRRIVKRFIHKKI